MHTLYSLILYGNICRTLMRVFVIIIIVLHKMFIFISLPSLFAFSFSSSSSDYLSPRFYEFFFFYKIVVLVGRNCSQLQLLRQRFFPPRLNCRKIRGGGPPRYVGPPLPMSKVFSPCIRGRLTSKYTLTFTAVKW